MLLLNKTLDILALEKIFLGFFSRKTFLLLNITKNIIKTKTGFFYPI
jgi:hypothetical protein